MMSYELEDSRITFGEAAHLRKHDCTSSYLPEAILHFMPLGELTESLTRTLEATADLGV